MKVEGEGEEYLMTILVEDGEMEAGDVAKVLQWFGAYLKGLKGRSGVSDEERERLWKEVIALG